MTTGTGDGNMPASTIDERKESTYGMIENCPKVSHIHVCSTLWISLQAASTFDMQS